MKKLLTVIVLTICAVAAHGQGFTPHINLAVPPQGYPNWANIVNGNWNKIDAAVGALQNGFQGTWNNTAIYSKGQSVNYNGGYYYSQVNSNQGNIPSASGSIYWTQVTVSTSVTGAQNLFYGTPSGASGSASLRALLNADLPQSLDVPSVRGATINGEITVDGNTYTNINAAWTAAVTAATNSGLNQTIRLGPGQYNVTATMVEPTNGSCVSIIGSAEPTIAAGTTQAATVLNVPASLSGDLFDLFNSTGAQAQSCNFVNLMIMGNKNINYAFNLQWFRGLFIEGVTINDSTAPTAIQLGEAASTGHQSNYKIVDVTVSYNAASFTPATRPAYGVWALPTAIDSEIDNLLVRNALQAAFYNQGGGTTTFLIHGFGFPYTCATAPCNNTESNPNAADASYASNFVVIDNGTGGNMYFNTYIDSPAQAGFDIEANGVQVNGGHIQWPDVTSFPMANLAWVQNTVTANIIIANIDCTNMSPNAGVGVPGAPANSSGWITYFLTNGDAPNYSFVFGLAGCGNYYQSRQSTRSTAFDIGGTNSSNTQAVTPKVYATPLSTSASEGGIEVENFAGGASDTFYSGFSSSYSNFAVRATGSIHTAGGLETGVQSVTTSTTLTSDVRQVNANASSGALTLTLPSCFTPDVDGLPRTGLELIISKTDTSANAVTLQTVSSQLIYNLGTGAATFTISAPSSYTLFCGTDNDWHISSGYAASSASGITTLTGDATSSGSPSATVTVVGINGTNLAGLGAGLLKQNASGVPAIAVAGTDYLTPGSSIAASQLPAFTGDVTTSAGSTATTVVAINNTNLAGLGAGLLKQNASGVPAVAVSGVDYIAPGTTVSLAGLTVTSGTNLSSLSVTGTGNATFASANLNLTNGDIRANAYISNDGTVQLLNNGVIQDYSFLQMGSPYSTNSPEIDFITAGSSNVNSRIQASGGTSTTGYNGTLTYTAATHTFVGTVQIPSLTMGGVTYTQAPHMTWSAYCPSVNIADTSNNLGCTIWQPTVPVEITALDLSIQVTLSGCTTTPMFGIYDATAASWVTTFPLTNGVFDYYNTTIDLPAIVLAGHKIAWGMYGAAVGCTGTGGFFPTIEYVME